MNTIKEGDKAPDFELQSHLDNNISLSSYCGQWVVLAFYPKDNSMVCTKELCSYNNYLANFNDLGINVLGINTDSVNSHKQFAEKQNINFPLLSDKHGKVSKAYDALYPVINKCKRAVYIIDDAGFIRYKYVEQTPLTYRKPKELLEKLNKLKADDLVKSLK